MPVAPAQPTRVATPSLCRVDEGVNGWWCLHGRTAYAGLSSIHCWRVLPESVCEGQFGCVPILGGGRRGTLSASQIPLATHTTRTTLTGATHHSSAKGLLSSMAPLFSLVSCAT